VARLVEITDPADPRVADYVGLRDVSLRKSLEAEHGLFLAEGEKVVRRAVQAGHAVRSFLMAPRWLDGLADVLAAAGDAPCYVVSEQVAERVTGFHVHRGALASLHRKPLPSVEHVLDRARDVVVLEDVVDHTNVGAVFRTAAALGVGGVLLSPRCADPLYRRSVKVAMGAVFEIPYSRLDDWYATPETLRRHGFRVVALTPAADAVRLEDTVEGQERVALLLGSEGHGLSRQWLQGADVRGRIEMAPAVDSLNIAAAAAIACYVLGGRR
jgi:tRNA G18 (ribose-2'-O)-methylase SpoU